jgi:hypothetical protein
LRLLAAGSAWQDRLERPVARRQREWISGNRLLQQRDQRGFFGIVEFYVEGDDEEFKASAEICLSL